MAIFHKMGENKNTFSKQSNILKNKYYMNQFYQRIVRIPKNIPCNKNSLYISDDCSPERNILASLSQHEVDLIYFEPDLVTFEPMSLWICFINNMYVLWHCFISKNIMKHARWMTSIYFVIARCLTSNILKNYFTNFLISGSHNYKVYSLS